MFNNRKGQGLVEALVGIGIVAISFISIAMLLADSFRLASRGSDVSSATSLAGEGINAVQSIARRNWTELVAGTYGLASPSNYWVFSGSSDVVGNFTRQLIVENVNRDGGGDIVTSGGSNDTETKKVTSRVTWTQTNGPASTLDSIIYVTRWFSQSSWIQTLLADFNLGKYHGTLGTSTVDGEVTLDTHGPYSIILSSAYVDVTGTSDGASIYVDDRNNVFIGTLANGSGAEFYVYDAADASNHVYTQLDSEELGANVNAIVVSGDYAYLATSADTAELRVYKLSTRAMVNSLNMTGTADALSLALNGTTLYIGRANNTSGAEFSSVSIASPESALSVSGNTELAFAVNGIAVTATHAFLATNDTANELRVIRLSDFANINSYNASGSNVYYAVKIVGTALYAASNNSNAEIEKIDITTPTGALTSLNTYSVPGNSTCRTVDAFSTRVVSGCDDGKLYVFAQTGLTLEGSSLLSPAGNPVGVMFGDGYLYTASTSDTSEFHVLRGASSDTAGWVSPTKVGELAMSNAQILGLDINGTTLYAGTTQRPGAEFNTIDVSTPATPSVIGTLNPDVLVTAVVYSGGYVFAGTSDGSNEIKVFDVTTPSSPSQVGQFNLNGSQNVGSLALVGTRLYVGRKAGGGAVRELTVLNIATPTAPTSLGDLELGADVNGVYVLGNYAYLATASNSQEVMIVNISNPASMSVVGSINQSGNTDALSIGGKDNWLFAGRGNHGGPELFVYDITTPTAPNQVATLEIGGATSAMSISGNILVTVSTNIWIIDIANLPTPNVLSTTAMGDQAQAIKVSGDCLYIGSSNSSKALQIYCKSNTVPGNSVSTEGLFRSQSFDATSAVVWDKISWTATTPSGTAIAFQIRTADTLLNLAAATFVGPDGTVNTWYTTSDTTIVTAPSATGTRFVQWQVNLTTSNTNNPSVESVTLTY